ncbi:malate permease [Xylogone sp. PMI_703]|nr:malate permease [Xylogone sp. PMI_703]
MIEAPRPNRGWHMPVNYAGMITTFCGEVKNFSPRVFTITIGTGISSILLYDMAIHDNWLYWLSVTVFCLNVVLFSLFTCVLLLRYILYPETRNIVDRYYTEILFFGAYSMSLGTIINMIVFVCVPAWGHPWPTIAWALWIFNATVAIVISFTLPFIGMNHPTEGVLQEMTAVYLFPFLATVVAAGTGSIVSDVLPSHHALWTLLVSYMIWGMGVPFAMIILVIYYQRLAIYKLPPKESVVTAFIPVGPLGLGGFGILQLGKVAMKVFPQTHTLHPLAGDVLYVVGFLVAIIMWGFGMIWLLFAILTAYKLRPFPFNMSWWSCIFPLGVYATSTKLLGQELPSKFFQILSIILSVCVLFLWILVSFKTIQKAITGIVTLETSSLSE